MKPITILQPQKTVFGSGCIQTFVDDYLSLGHRRLFILTAPPILPLIEPAIKQLKDNGVNVEVFQNILAEPTLNDFNTILSIAREF